MGKVRSGCSLTACQPGDEDAPDDRAMVRLSAAATGACVA
jgi:hypothetical protein